MVAHDALLAWENFYIIVGSSAGALTGLQFVVMALAAETEMNTDTGEVDAFGTPTIVHFCAVLLVSAILSMPWSEISQAAIAAGICGAFGVGYTLIVLRRARRTRNYKPEMEDWIWHTILPLLAYVTLLISSALIPLNDAPPFFGIAAFALLLLFVGIHNAWDSVTYMALASLKKRQTKNQEPPGSASTTPQRL
jgi:amino acid transporter